MSDNKDSEMNDSEDEMEMRGLTGKETFWAFVLLILLFCFIFAIDFYSRLHGADLSGSAETQQAEPLNHNHDNSSQAHIDELEVKAVE